MNGRSNYGHRGGRQRRSEIRIAGLLAAALLTGCATGPENKPMAGERYALIQTGVARSAQRIFPVEIYQIDGREVAGGRTLHQVEPGVHSIRARARVDRALSGGVGRGGSGGGDTLTHNFQSGQRYFLGLKADAPRSADWALVIWKIEDVEAGTVSLDTSESQHR